MALLFLHDHPVSSYAAKVRIALREKGLPFDSAVPPGAGRGNGVPAIAAANPREEVPVLEDRESGTVIFDSTIILDYLDDKWPDNALTPAGSDAAKRAEDRMIELVVGSSYEAINWGWGEVLARTRDAQQQNLLGAIKKQAVCIQTWLEEKLDNDDFFAGNKCGRVDFCVAPFLGRSVFYGIGPVAGSKLGQWFLRISERESVKETLREMNDAAQRNPNILQTTFLESPRGSARRMYRDHRLELMIKSGGMTVVQEGLDNNNIRFSWPDLMERES